VRANAIAVMGFLFGFCVTPAQEAGAARYPERPVRVVALNPPGGVSDLVARSVGEYLSEKWGQPFVVDNRVGAGGIIGSQIVAQAPADGYTLLLGFVGNLSINPGLHEKLPYDPLKDFAPISLAARSPIVVVANPGLPVKSIVDLIKLAKSKPGELRYASSGIGNGNHLATELFAAAAGVKLLHVPYKGGAPALTAVIQNEVAVLFGNSTLVMPQLKAGRVKALAVTTEERLAPLPDVPTMRESGLPEYVVTTWFGLLAPAGTPSAVVKQLNAGVVDALGDARLRQKFDAAGLIPSPSSPQQFADLIRSETARWRQVIADNGVRAN
jgi:tripartite-type tricarboxylate transporter receptor subunit TctC